RGPRSAPVLRALLLALGRAAPRMAAAQSPDPTARAGELDSEARRLGREGRYAAGAAKAREAVALRESALGPQHPSVAGSLTIQAGLLRLAGSYAAARPLLDPALRPREQALGLGHPCLPHLLDAIGRLADTLGRFAHD